MAEQNDTVQAHPRTSQSTARVSYSRNRRLSLPPGAGIAPTSLRRPSKKPSSACDTPLMEGRAMLHCLSEVLLYSDDADWRHARGSRANHRAMDR